MFKDILLIEFMGSSRLSYLAIFLLGGLDLDPYQSNVILITFRFSSRLYTRKRFLGALTLETRFFNIFSLAC